MRNIPEILLRCVTTDRKGEEKIQEVIMNGEASRSAHPVTMATSGAAVTSQCKFTRLNQKQTVLRR